MSTKVLIPTTVNDTYYSIIKDVVFDRWISGKRDHSFKLGRLIKRTSAISLDELSTPDEVGAEGGTGIYKIAGEIALTCNSANLMDSLNVQDGQRYAMHILYTDGTASSVPFIDANGIPLAYTSDFQYITDRYPNASVYRDYFGVRLTIKKEFGGANRTAKLVLSGMTLEDVSCIPRNDADFYSRFSIK